ncbi:hypothetical protein GOBAR_DD06078 [Gossypium barbadense]|nr:hypothetical protein GOBAR_DD06078 [Gossypium barbadense]
MTVDGAPRVGIATTTSAGVIRDSNGILQEILGFVMDWIKLGREVIHVQSGHVLKVPFRKVHLTRDGHITFAIGAANIGALGTTLLC